jgi:hypothetical protein
MVVEFNSLKGFALQVTNVEAHFAQSPTPKSKLSMQRSGLSIVKVEYFMYSLRLGIAPEVYIWFVLSLSNLGTTSSREVACVSSFNLWQMSSN